MLLRPFLDAKSKKEVKAMPRPDKEIVLALIDKIGEIILAWINK